MTGRDSRIQDLGQTVLTLRPELVLTPRLEGEEPGYVIEDKVNSKYYRLGMPEYTFVSLLDGKTTVDEALGITARAEPEHGLTEDQAATICRWLVENHLAYTDDTIDSQRLAADAQGPERSAARWNPLFLRVPLFHPNRLFAALVPWTSWLFARPTMIVVALLACIAAYQLLSQWDRFVASTQGIVAADRWLWIGICWLVLKLLHELAHGIVCRRYGGAVREAGVMLILTAPVAYVDLTASWSLRSKWQRIHTAAAGMYVELFIASVAALLWSQLRGGLLSDLCCQITVMASITTILFNANPLMRFDGYYILSDLLEIPNLYGQGQQFLKHIARKYLMGVTSKLPIENLSQRVLVGTYGIAAWLWRIVVCIGLATAASAMFRGAGIALAVVAIGLWIGPPTLATFRYLIGGGRWEQPNRTRFCLITGTALTALAAAIVWLPWPGRYWAPGVVEYAPLAIVRSASPGFLREVHVRPGEIVTRGQLLAVLENEQLQLELSELQLRLRQSRDRVRSLLHEGKMAACQAERKQLEVLQRRRTNRQEQFDKLTLRAPIDGTVVARELESMLGKYLGQGAEILAIGNEDRKELRISIAQDDFDIFKASLNQPLRVRLRGTGRFTASLASMRPQASLDPPGRGLCAPLGGRLPVRVVESSQPQEGQSSNRYQLLAPRFEGKLALSPHRSSSLCSGQRAVVTLHSRQRSIAVHALSKLNAWLDGSGRTFRAAF